MTYVCCAILMLIVLAGILAPLLAPHDPLQQHLEQRLAGPSMDYPLGTDQFGRCILSRILFAARATLGFAILCTLIAACIGIFLGTIAGFKGRRGRHRPRGSGPGAVVLQLPGLAQQGAVVGLVQQLVVGAGRDDAAPLHDGDAVGAAHGGGPVGDDQDGAPAQTTDRKSVV